MSKKSKLLIILLSLFIVILVGVLTHNLSVFDNFIYTIVTFNKCNWATKFYKFITFFGSTKFMVVLALFLLILMFKNKKGSFITIGLIISTILNNVLKLIIRRERPLELMMVKESTFSFPSGHAMASTTMYGLIIYLIWKSKLEKKLKILYSCLLGLLILLIGLSRIYLGVHFASDILGAMLVSSMLIIIYVSFIENKKLI